MLGHLAIRLIPVFSSLALNPKAPTFEVDVILIQMGHRTLADTLIPYHYHNSPPNSYTYYNDYRAILISLIVALIRELFFKYVNKLFPNLLIAFQLIHVVKAD
jgi:hypothetical protein